MNRSNLPLSFIDSRTTLHPGPLNSTFIFAKIQCLDQLEENGSGQRSILVARCVTDQSLYAIESVLSGLFTICRLASWVTVPMIEKLQASIGQHHDHARLAIQDAASLDESNWWQHASVGQLGHLLGPQDTPGRNILDSAKLPVAEDCYFEHNRHAGEDHQEPQKTDILDDVETFPLQEPRHDPRLILGDIRNHYQEALYASKVCKSPSFCCFISFYFRFL